MDISETCERSTMWHVRWKCYIIDISKTCERLVLYNDIGHNVKTSSHKQ